MDEVWEMSTAVVKEVLDNTGELTNTNSTQ